MLRRWLTFSLLPLCFSTSLLLAAPQDEVKSSDTIDVHAKGVAPDEAVGDYKQPQWSAHRPFTTSRAYVIPKGTLEGEVWLKSQSFKDGSPNKHLLQEEVEVGLAHHIQLDLYFNQVNVMKEDGTRMWDYEGTQYELRWALGDWGQIPLNPTLYFEYHPRKNAPEKGEFRLLLADTLAPQWHFSTNLGFEQELWGDELERELVATVAIGTTMFHPSLSVGLEVKNEWVDVKDNRGHYHVETVAGPSFQWRPCEGTHVDFAPLMGVQNDAPRFEAYLIVGTDLN